MVIKPLPPTPPHVPTDLISLPQAAKLTGHDTRRIAEMVRRGNFRHWVIEIDGKPKKHISMADLMDRFAIII